MAEAFIAGAVRTAIGKRNGSLSGVNPVDLGAHALRGLVDRTGIDPAAVDDVIMGCVSQIGPQTFDIARNAWLSAGLPESVPGVTVDRQCGSSQQAVHFAAQAVMSGTQDLVIAAGVESMSIVTMGSTVTLAMQAGMPAPFGPGWRERYGDQEISQFRGAQLICEQWGFKRSQLEEFALESHQRAVRAIDEGRFESQIVPLDGFSQDEGPRRDTSLEKMAGLAPLRPDWEITAAVSLGTVGLDWQVACFAPISATGASDMVLRNTKTGEFEVYDIANNQITNAAFMGTVGLDWQQAAFGNFSSRGTSDMVLRNTKTGGLEVYDIDSNQITGAASLGSVGMDWQLGGFAADGPGASSAAMGTASEVGQLVQAMASFGAGSGAADGLNASSLAQDSAQQALLTTPQHA